ncbi:MAG: GerMN domain-containing protein [bacterium]
MKIKKLSLLIIIPLILLGLIIFFFTQREDIKFQIPFFKPKEIKVKLYFSSKDAKSLVLEEHRIPRLADPLSQAKEILKELIKGPESKDLFPTLPEETQVRAVYFHEDTAYVDFSAELTTKHPGGSCGEIQTIFSIVNTLTINFPKIKYVQILVEGKEVETIAGHIDTTMPFKQNLSLIYQHKKKE